MNHISDQIPYGAGANEIELAQALHGEIARGFAGLVPPVDELTLDPAMGLIASAWSRAYELRNGTFAQKPEARAHAADFISRTLEIVPKSTLERAQLQQLRDYVDGLI